MNDCNKFLIDYFRRYPIQMSLMAFINSLAKLIEIFSLILPLKGVLIFLNPEMLPVFITSRGFEVNDVMVLILIAVILIFILARLLYRISYNLGLQLIQNKNTKILTNKKAIHIAGRLLSSLVAVASFILIVFVLEKIAAAIIFAILLLIFLFQKYFSDLKFWVILKKVIAGDDTRDQFKLLGHILFILFFCLFICFMLTGISKPNFSLLVVVLISRRLFQEYARLRVSIISLDELLKH